MAAPTRPVMMKDARMGPISTSMDFVTMTHLTPVNLCRRAGKRTVQEESTMPIASPVRLMSGRDLTPTS